MTKPADWRAREMALEPGLSCIVQAPAGSGKTELLIQRMLRLLATVDEPEEVVAITFTRKAAREMQNRLISELQAASQPEIDRAPGEHERDRRKLAEAALQHARNRGWDLPAQPSRLRIRTIDSLSNDLARQLPILSGLGGTGQVSSQPELLYSEAAARTLAALEDRTDEVQPHVARILDRYDNQYDRLIDLLASMLANRDQWLPQLLELRSGDGFSRESLELGMRFLVETELAEAARLLPDTLSHELTPFLQFADEHIPDAARAGALRELLRCTRKQGNTRPGTCCDDLRHWKTLADCLVTQGARGWRKRVTAKEGFPPPGAASGEEKLHYESMKKGFIALLQEHSHLDDLRLSLGRIQTLPEPVYDDDSWAALESLLHLMRRAAAEWQLLAAQQRAVDFVEVSARAVEALGSDDIPSPLALKLDYRIQHLLVDEFQDTSSGQISLIRRLTAGWTGEDGRSLFLVGDPMQSIYRFRKAEVSLFIRAWNGALFDHLKLRALQLEVNFRSNRPVVEWVNTVFPHIMPSQDDPVMGSVSFRPSLTRHDVPNAGSVSLEFNDLRNDEKEARRVIELIDGFDANDEVAVLVRSRSHAHTLMSQLDRLKYEQSKYRYQAIEFQKLGDTPLVRDLLSLTLALQQPADRLAWLAVLRAPFVGLNLRDLELLAGNDPNNIIAGALKEPPPLSADGKARLARAAPILLEALRLRGRQAVRNLVEHAWTWLGGPACLEQPGQLRDARTYLDLLSDVSAGGLPLDRDSLEYRLESLYAAPDSLASGKLKIMTIYAAKGLQFDHVILPGLNRVPSAVSSRLVHWFELAGTGRFVMSPMYTAEEKARNNAADNLIRFISDTEKRRQQLETARLMYVAATRAIQSLHLLGSVTPRADGEIEPAKDSLAKVLWRAVGNDCAEQIAALSSASSVNAKSGPARTEFSQLQTRLPVAWKLPKRPARIHAPGEVARTVEENIAFDWAGEDARIAGQLVHRLLQHISNLGLKAWQSCNPNLRKLGWCRNFLFSHGIDEPRSTAILKKCEAALESCTNSETGRWVLDTHEQAQSEFAITVAHEGLPRRLVLDRTFIDGGTRWVIDYKLSSHRGGDLEGFLEQEVERYSAQLDRYRRVFDSAGDLPVRTALYYPLLDRLLEVGPGTS